MSECGGSYPDLVGVLQRRAVAAAARHEDVKQQRGLEASALAYDLALMENRARAAAQEAAAAEQRVEAQVPRREHKLRSATETHTASQSVPANRQARRPSAEQDKRADLDARPDQARLAGNRAAVFAVAVAAKGAALLTRTHARRLCYSILDIHTRSR